MTSFEDHKKKKDEAEHDEVCPAEAEGDDPMSPGQQSRREIARQIALAALQADRHLLETSAAVAFRDFRVSPA